jgi:hypothetical protein
MLNWLVLSDLESTNQFCLHGLNLFLSFFSIYIPSFPYIFVSAMFLYCLALLTFILPFLSPLIYFSFLQDEQQHKGQENLLDIHDHADTDASSPAMESYIC